MSTDRTCLPPETLIGRPLAGEGRGECRDICILASESVA